MFGFLKSQLPGRGREEGVDLLIPQPLPPHTEASRRELEA
jgi:hypothetical protein